MSFRKLMALSVVGACAAGWVLAQEQSQATRSIQIAQKDKAEKSEAKKPSARMPNYFRSLGLSDQQREKILNTIIEHNEQIDELEEQITELKEKRDAEVHAILTATQKTKLAELQMDAKKKRAEKADKSKKSAEPAGEEK
jgi:hypothetical protein